MATKHILGLDLGTNSIGWAVVDANESEKGLQPNRILKAGSRIIPMDAALMGDFEAGNSISQTHDRTMSRGMRRLYERRALRRERLNRVLNILGFLPEHYAQHLNRYGQLLKGTEPKLAWAEKDGNRSFLFQTSFDEMCAEFRAVHPELLANGRKIAYDWTIYYLRKKALTRALTGSELAWILLQFNQKRGYNQARGEEEEVKETERKEFMSLLVTKVTKTDEISKGNPVYEIVLENGMSFFKPSKYPVDWVNKKKNFIVTTQLNEDGSEKLDKEGKVRRSFRVPDDNDWGLLKIKTEHDIEMAGKTVGEFIYDALLQNPDEKIIGKLVRVVDRKYYKEELHRIIRTQMQFIPQLTDDHLYQECIEALYVQNEPYRQSIARRDFDYLLVDNILFYQRPLKSKKSLINECPYEYHLYKDKDGNWKRQYLKCIPKSHPLYEEFRVRQFVNNLAIYREIGDGLNRHDCTTELITDREALVKWLMGRKDVEQGILIKEVTKQKKPVGYSWNYISDKTYPMAPTCATLSKAFESNGGLVTTEAILQLWHILYSVSDRAELEQALRHYAKKNGLQEDFVLKLKKQKPFEQSYGAYSLKATSKLLSLMRSGNAWGEIDSNTRSRIEKILTGEDDANIPERVREKCREMNSIEDFQGLPVWLAEYVVYGIRDNSTKWEKPEDIDDYIQHFRLHSLNNPIVEQVVMETLRVVRDIWRETGSIDEIHLEMGRELKLPADKRKQIQRRQIENEKANTRAKILLREFMNPDMEIEGVRDFSSSQLELFRLYETGALAANNVPDDILPIINALGAMKQPSHGDVRKYRLWLDQKYVSPYTRQPIPLSKLFTPAYQIEHIIPQSRYFDDSMSNKVICEAEVNALKDRQLGHEFILQHGGESVTLSGGRVVNILTKEAYEQTVKELFGNDRAKAEKLMLDDIPEKFIARQMNDSRYISVLMKGLLSNIVREQNPLTHEYEPEATSKNLIVCNGAVTDRLKKDWGVNDVWNHIILPRFERLNEIQNTHVFTATTANGHRIPNVPLEFAAGFSKKRIDHRHHAMDAIVIACTTRNHVNLLSNEAALDKTNQARLALSHLLRQHTEQTYKGKSHFVFGDFLKPWDTFTQDVESVLRDILVSFKQNLRVINRSNNRSVRFVDGKKKTEKQTKGDNWAIRKSMHKETVFGLVNLRMKKTANLSYALLHLDDIVEKDLRVKLRELLAEGRTEKQIKQYFKTEKDTWADINLQKIEVYYFTNDTKDRYYATRTAIDETFDEKFIREKITDTGIQQILLRHLEACGGDPKLAFSQDGIDQMNKNIVLLNGGRPHKPIYKVRKYEKAEKYAVGEVGVKAKKYVEAAKGTNLYFAIYVTNVDGKDVRSFVTVPLRVAIRCQQQAKDWKPLLDQWIKTEQIVSEKATLKYLLSPGDLVYVPSEEEQKTGVEKWDNDRVYKVVSFTGNRLYVIPISVASCIVDKVEYTQLNKMEFVEGISVRNVCIKIVTDRLGNIIS